jgi:hypothetical protein
MLHITIADDGFESIRTPVVTDRNRFHLRMLRGTLQPDVQGVRALRT